MKNKKINIYVKWILIIVGILILLNYMGFIDFGNILSVSQPAPTSPISSGLTGGGV